MSLIALSRLVIEGRSDSHPVAWRNGQAMDFRRFRADVAKKGGQFKNCRSAVLVCQDSYNFSLGFLVLLNAGKDIVLPPYSQPDTLRNLKEEFDLVVEDHMIANG